jgi:hypothetical protein
MVNIMAGTKSNVVTGTFSTVTGSDTRRMFDKEGNFLGLIVKTQDGYKVSRFADGKVRTKRTLREAYSSIARSN